MVEFLWFESKRHINVSLADCFISIDMSKFQSAIHQLGGFYKKEMVAF